MGVRQPGTYSVNVTVSGPSAGEYEVVFSNGDSLLIFGPHQEPPTPRLLSVTFSSDGSSILLAFDSATSRGVGVAAGGGSNFCNCSKLLQLRAIEFASCRWADDATSLTIFPGSRGTVSVGSSVALLGGVLQTACSTNMVPAACASWKYVASTRLKVAPPANAAPPAVVLAMPATIGE